jgi:ribonucleoside-diphosphate reductase alpha chain
MPLTQVRKRDGRLAAFDASKIGAALGRALEAAQERVPLEAGELGREVATALEARFPTAVPGVEDVQDVVEETLVRHGLARTAKHYILYRQQRADIRAAKSRIGVRDPLKLTVNAVQVLKKRYLLRDGRGQVRESPEGLFRRVARAVAAAEPDRAEGERLEEDFFQMMAALDFLPNSPTLMNAGTPVGQLSACFVLPVEDSIPDIFQAVTQMALVHKSGGGTGFSFSRLRPRGEGVSTTGGLASGPLSFMRIFDVTTDVIRQGGRRRGANMAILRCDHPDIREFITAKDHPGTLTNFNLSVGATDEFMAAVEADRTYPLRVHGDDRPRGQLPAREVFRLIVSQAWRTGDPGLVFLDAINRGNPTPELGAIESTNPCGEQPLLPFEACNLGSINLKHMIKGGALDREKLSRTVQLAVRFLDDIIEVNRWPLPQTEQLSRGNRKIGLGLMGFADALLLVGIPYASEEALRFADDVGAILQEESHRESARLAGERGVFPNYKGSVWERAGLPMRNATTTTIAPTGSISIIAGCSSGIEPLFALSFVRNVIEGTQLFETNPIFEQTARERGFHSDELLAELARRGSVRGMAGVPDDVQRLFLTAFDVSPEWHVRMQAAFQQRCDNAVSKTINFPPQATMEEVERAYRLAWSSGCKGITVYRYGSKPEQVLNLGVARAIDGPEFCTADAEYAGGCPTGECCT